MNNEFLANSTPEQRILWHYARTLIAFNTITPLYFQGAIAGSEFVTYNAGKLYVCLNSVFNTAGGPSALGYITLYDMANAINFYLQKTVIDWDVAAAAHKFVTIDSKLNNCFFSRLATTQYTHMIFNGYRLDV